MYTYDIYAQRTGELLEKQLPIKDYEQFLVFNKLAYIKTLAREFYNGKPTGIVLNAKERP